MWNSIRYAPHTSVGKNIVDTKDKCICYSLAFIFLKIKAYVLGIHQNKQMHYRLCYSRTVFVHLYVEIIHEL